MGIPLQTPEYSDNSAGLDLISSPTKTLEASATASLNTDYSEDGAVFTRHGSSRLNATQHNAGEKTLLLYDYRKSDGTNTQIVCNGTTIAHSLTSPVNQVTGLSATLPIPSMEYCVTSDDEYALWGNGVDADLKFDGTDWTNLSIERPIAPSGADNGVGLLDAGSYWYYVEYVRLDGTVITQKSELSPESIVTTIGATRKILVTIPVSTDPQVDGRVIYRIGPNSLGVAYRHHTIADNTTTTWEDNTNDDGTIEAEYDNQAAPLSDVFCEFQGSVYYKDAANPTDLVNSKAYKPWNVPSTTRAILDGKITAMHRVFNTVVIGTNKSIWSQDYSGNLRRICNGIGILNSRCIDGDTYMYFMATNKKVYRIGPSDLDQDQLDLSNPLTNDIDPLLKQIGGSAADQICIKYVNRPNLAKVIISVPLGVSNNDHWLVFNERQSMIKGKSVWQYYDNMNSNALSIFIINGNQELIGGDYNGFMWKHIDESTNGDGAEDNGTALGTQSATTLQDTSKTWGVNAFVGINVSITDGTGEGQTRLVLSNTVDELTFTSAWTVTPDDTSVYTIGGYESYHYSNWKAVVSSYEVLKQLWYVWINANASGDYNIRLILQFDFDTTLNNQVEVLLNLRSENTIWGAFFWGAAIWGSRSVFLDRFRQWARFRAVRVIFYHDKAGQPWQINNYALSVQDKGLLFEPYSV